MNEMQSTDFVRSGQQTYI